MIGRYQREFYNLKKNIECLAMIAKKKKFSNEYSFVMISEYFWDSIMQSGRDDCSENGQIFANCSLAKVTKWLQNIHPC